MSPSVRPQHSSEQEEKEDTPRISIQQELYTFVLNKEPIIEFLNKWRMKEQKQNDTVWPFT